MNGFDFSSKKTVVSIYCDPSRTESHLTGFVHSVSDSEILISHISPDGQYDGFVLIHRDDVFRIDTNGKYELRVGKLYKLKNQHHPSFSCGTDLLSSLLGFCVNNQIIVSLELGECELYGFVKDYENNNIKMELVDEYGKPDGETIVSSEFVNSISADSLNEQNIKLLFLAEK